MLEYNKQKYSPRELNILSILHTIIDNQEASSTEIIDTTGLSNATVSRVLNTLKTRNIIVSKGKEITNLGRRPEKVSINCQYGYIAHFNINEDVIVGFLSDLNGTVLATEQRAVDGKITVEMLKEKISDAFYSLEEVKRQNKEVLALSFSVPCAVSSDSRTINRTVDVFSFTELDFSDLIEDMLKIPVVVNNIAMLMALGQYKSINSDVDSMVFVCFSRAIGIGCGIVIDGELFKGHSNYAGEIGYMLYSTDNFDRVQKKNIGSLEEKAGLRAIYVNVMAKVLDGGALVLKKMLDSGEKLDILLIEKAIMLGDLDCKEILDEALKIWSIALINIYLTINPKVIVIGGAISAQNSYILKQLSDIFANTLLIRPNIMLSTLTYDEAQLIGGVSILKEYVFDNIVGKKALEE